MAVWLVLPSSDHEVPGLNPAEPVMVVQSDAHLTADLKVMDSTGSSNILS